MAKISLLIVVLVLSVVDVALALSASNVKAMYHYYGADENNWDLKAANAYCSSADGSQSLAWRKKFGWTAFCGPSGPTGHAACGKCLKVTNAKTGKQVTVRIIDTCTMGGLKLDATVFRFLDNGKEGYYRGYLMVNYEFVSCLGS